MSMASREDSSVVTLLRPEPRRVGRYEICFELAAGGMATIYLARSEGPGGFRKPCVLKCIHPHLVRDAGFVEMFLDEARLASRINHPNVCSVYDFGFADNTYFIAMEFLVGETVGRLCKLTEQRPELVPLPMHAAYVARIIADAAQGLHAAHELRGDDGAFLNLVHRDVSPQNVMVSYDGAVKMMDFGIARTVDQMHLTRTGTVRGKFPYMAPEQAEQAPLDRRADVWSLGVVLWEMLTGQRLFHREREVDTIRAVLSAPVPPPNAIRSGIPREIEDITMRALQRDPARRFQSAHELAVALDNLRGKRDAIATQAALATWLRQLFPDLYARRLELVDQVRQMSEGSVPRISRALAEPSLDTRPMADVNAAVVDARPRKRVWLMVGAALLTCAIGAGAWLALRERPAASPAPTTQIAKAATPAPIVVPAPIVAALPAQPAPSLPALPLEPVADEPAQAVETQMPVAAAHHGRTGHGSVNIATPGGWADVFVAGRHRGRTPLQLELPEGKRALVLKPFGAKPMKRFVIVRRDQLTRLVVPISQKP